MLRLNRMFFQVFFCAGLAVAIAATVLGCSWRTAEPKPAITVATKVEALISQYLTDTALPAGIGVAIYTPQGSYSNGFGLAHPDGPPVTADTAFYIASSTKSFVAVAMNNLHHQGLINLDTSLAAFSPDAPLPEAVKPDQVRLRDLLTHTSGISNDAIAIRSAYTGEHTPQQLWQLLAKSTVNTAAPHGQFDYTNTGYNILTILTDKQLNSPWQQIVSKEILQPAGMERTTAYLSIAKQQNWSVASPMLLSEHADVLEPMDFEKQDATMHSAGGMFMSSTDASRWLEIMVRQGKLGDKQILPSEVVEQTLQAAADVGQQFGPYERQHYGLGWYLGRYDDQYMVQHFGSFSGFRAHVSFMPEHQIGVAVFTNEALNGSFLPDAIANFIYDNLTGKVVDTSERSAELVQKFKKLSAAYRASQQKLAQRQWALTLPPEEYAGNYVSTELGSLQISTTPLRARLGLLHAVATAYPDSDSIRVAMTPPSANVIKFDVKDGVVLSATLFNTRFDKQ